MLTHGVTTRSLHHWRSGLLPRHARGLCSTPRTLPHANPSYTHSPSKTESVQVLTKCDQNDRLAPAFGVSYRGDPIGLIFSMELPSKSKPIEARSNPTEFLQLQSRIAQFRLKKR